MVTQFQNWEGFSLDRINECCVCGDPDITGSLMRTDPRYSRVRDMLTVPEVPRRRVRGVKPNIALCHFCQRRVYHAGGFLELLAKKVKRAAQAVNASGNSCPRCGTGNPYWLKTRKRYKCRNRECHHQYSKTSHTGGRHPKIPSGLKEKIKQARASGMSASEVAKKFNVNEQTAWRAGPKAMKVSEQDVVKIRELRGKKTQREIANMFGISTSYVSDIQRGVNRKQSS